VSSSTAEEAKEAAAAETVGAGGPADSSFWAASPLALGGEGEVEASEGEGPFDLMAEPLEPPSPGFSFSFQLPDAEELPWQ
jgi:hypothetical protein